MKRFIFGIVVVLVAALALNGCVSISKYTPTKTAEEEKPVIQTKIGKTEPKFKVEVELLEKPDFSRFSAPKTPDKELSGNRGNFAKGIITPEGGYQAAAEEQPKVWWSEMPQQPEQAEQKEIVMEKYKVKKGQTLADISMDVYGTTKKWKKIYEANKDKIKDPNKIYAGQILNIPVESTPRRLK